MNIAEVVLAKSKPCVPNLEGWVYTADVVSVLM